MNNARKLGAQSAGVFILNIFAYIIATLYVVVVGRFIGADDYGEVLYVVSIFSVIEVFTKFGFSNSLVMFLARDDIDDAAKRWLVRLSFGTSAVLSGVAITAFLMLPWLTSSITGRSGVERSMILVMLPFIFNETLIDLISAILRARGEVFRYVFVSSLLGKLVQFVTLAVFVFLGIRGTSPIIFTYYISQWISLAWGLILAARRGMLFGDTEPFSVKLLFSMSFFQLFTGILSVLNREIDKYVLGYCIDSASVAIYSTAVRISSVSSMMLSAINTAFSPMISRLYYAGKLKELAVIYKRATKWIVTANLFIAGVIFIFSVDIMRIFGEEFVGGGMVLCVVMIGELVNSGVGSVGFMNSMTGHPHLHMISSGVGLISNIVLNIILVGRYGIIGVGVATAVALAVRNLVDYFFMRRSLHIHPYSKKYIGVIVTAAVSYLLLIFLKSIMDIHYLARILVCGIIYTFVYASLVYKLVCEKDEKDLIDEFIRKFIKNTDTKK